MIIKISHKNTFCETDNIDVARRIIDSLIECINDFNDTTEYLYISVNETDNVSTGNVITIPPYDSDDLMAVNGKPCNDSNLDYAIIDLLHI